MASQHWMKTYLTECLVLLHIINCPDLFDHLKDATGCKMKIANFALNAVHVLLPSAVNIIAVFVGGYFVISAVIR